MHALKVQVKVFASADADALAYVPVFHRWIRDGVLGELGLYVVDYSHVPNGPDVVLVGHASDYSLDRAHGRLGLLYASKREAERADGPFLPAIRKALRACRLLEQESEPNPKLAFKADELLFRVADRLQAPNNDETFERLEPALRSALSQLYGNASFEVRRTGEPRDLFSVAVRASGAASLAQLSAHID